MVIGNAGTSQPQNAPVPSDSKSCSFYGRDLRVKVQAGAWKPLGRYAVGCSQWIRTLCSEARACCFKKPFRGFLLAAWLGNHYMELCLSPMVALQVTPNFPSHCWHWQHCGTSDGPLYPEAAYLPYLEREKTFLLLCLSSLIARTIHSL